MHAARAAALALAVHRLRRDREHLPVVGFLAWITIVDLVRWWINHGPLAGVTGPFVGWLRFYGHLDSALFISWHFGMAVLARRAFGRQTVWPVGLAYAITVAALVASYPAVRAGRLALAYAAIELLALAASFAAIITWAWRRHTPSVTHVCVLVLVFVEVANLAGPYMSDLFNSWAQAQVVYVALYTGLILVQWFPLPFVRHP